MSIFNGETSWKWDKNQSTLVHKPIYDNKECEVCVRSYAKSDYSYNLYVLTLEQSQKDILNKSP